MSGTQLREVEFVQPIVEPPEPGKFGIKSESAIIGDFAVIFVKPESGSLERASSEVAFDVFLGHRFVIGIGSLRREAGRRRLRDPRGALTMNAFTVHTGTAVPLRRSDVDTDQIIPSDWLKRVERTGFGAGLFSEWRDDPVPKFGPAMRMTASS